MDFQRKGNCYENQMSIKLNIGCGGNLLPGWRNMDIMFTGEDYIDITQTLPFPDSSVSRVYSSHCVEHVTPVEGYKFLKECFRVLESGGVLRVCVPSIVQVMKRADKLYINWVAKQGFAEANLRSCIEALILGHGHKTIWDEAALEASMYAAGFSSMMTCQRNESIWKDMQKLDMHWKVIGEHNDWVESIVVEGVKP